MSVITPLTPEELSTAKQEALKESYPVRVLIAFDIFMNVVFRGNPDETISSRAARAATESKLWGRLVSKFLNLFQKNHGAKAEAGDIERAEQVEKLESQSGNV